MTRFLLLFFFIAVAFRGQDNGPPAMLRYAAVAYTSGQSGGPFPETVTPLLRTEGWMVFPFRGEPLALPLGLPTEVFGKDGETVYGGAGSALGILKVNLLSGYSGLLQGTAPFRPLNDGFDVTQRGDFVAIAVAKTTSNPVCVRDCGVVWSLGRLASKTVCSLYLISEPAGNVQMVRQGDDCGGGYRSISISPGGKSVL